MLILFELLSFDRFHLGGPQLRAMTGNMFSQL
jgi:hypothetical protein